MARSDQADFAVKQEWSREVIESGFHECVFLSFFHWES
jgi:hypothetical protein